MYHILIVEDDRDLNHGIALALQGGGTELASVYSLAQAREYRSRQPVDMVLLDINLPDGSGYELLTEIRETSQLPVLMITANDLEVDEVTGLTLGADDYITKPFSLMVLRARVERMRKRTAGTAETADYKSGRYAFFFEKMKFLADGEEISLSKSEQKLLRLFVKYPGQTLTRERLTEALWQEGAEYVDANALSVTVNRLRHKLEGREKTCPIQTVYGLGYVWEKQV